MKLEVRDIAWYKSKAKEINALREETTPTTLRLKIAFNNIIVMLESSIIKSRPLPRFKNGCINTKNCTEALIKKRKKSPAALLSRMRCNMINNKD